jgi:hypothetical protein
VTYRERTIELMSDATKSSEASTMDARLRTAIGTVLAFGAVATLFAGLGWGVPSAFSAGVGAALASSNLYALARILQALLAPLADAAPATPGEAAQTPASRRASIVGWAFLAMVKMTILFGGIWLLMARGYVEAIPLLVGYGSLPLGIAAGAIVSDRTGAARS